MYDFKKCLWSVFLVVCEYVSVPVLKLLEMLKWAGYEKLSIDVPARLFCIGSHPLKMEFSSAGESDTESSLQKLWDKKV